MKNFYAVFLCIIFSILFLNNAFCQNNKLITGNFQGYSFAKFVNEIEASSNFHFYYDSAEVDSFFITANVSEVPLKQLLDQVFNNTDFHYAIDTSGHIFISKGVTIQTSLPSDFFDLKKIKNGEAKKTDAIKKEILPNKGQLKISADNTLVEIGNKLNSSKQGAATIAGYVRDKNTGEAIVSASLSVDNSGVAVTTNQYGYFSLTMPKGRHVLNISSSGMKEAKRQIILYADGTLDVDMQEFVASLKTVIVSAEKTSNIKNVQMGTSRLSIATIKQIPVVFGEADVLKVVLTLPGVTSVGEASNGFNVRGGSSDQNLILFSDATVYNPAHLFGFFSAFNPDVVKGIELYKSAIPEKYGGRLSSVLDVSMLDGNSKKWAGTVGLGPVTSKIMIEGPLKKNKTSIIAAGRTTYSNWLLKTIPNNSYSNSRGNFYDANLRITHIIDSKNSLYLMGYISGDQFNLNKDTTYKYSNKNANIKWKHIFNNKSNAVVTFGVDHYQYSVSSSIDTLAAYKLGFSINQNYFRSDFIYTPNNKHVISYGVNTIYYKLHPGYYDPTGEQSLVVQNTVPQEQALESALYLGDLYSINSRLSINAGLRYSLFNYLGPHDVYNYLPGMPKEVENIIDTTSYASGKNIKTYSAPEIRFSARYQLSDNASIKLSYNTLQQYIHMLSNTITISPTDIWKLSDPNIKPQQGNQISLGLYKNFKANTIETSIEVYYKRMKNFLDYKSGANLVLNHHIETDVFSTKGKAYGVEFLVKKLTGRVNGWLSYTYSRTFIKQDDPLAGEIINKGNYYPASFDKPHNVNFIGNYRFSHRFSLSLNVVYSTGRPITLPLAVFNLGGSTGLYYSDRNQYRIPDYFRTDISMNIEGNHKLKKVSHNFWSVGIYNLTGRQNAYSVYFVEENGLIKGYKLSIFGTLIPFISYNIKF
jgi:hypothetical protein